MPALDPHTPAAEAFIADWLSDYPDEPFEEAAKQSGAIKCEDCARLFSSADDFDPDAPGWFCHECEAERRYCPIKRCWVAA